MGSNFINLNGIEIFFLICAMAGGVFVLMRLVFQFIGGEAELDSDVDGSHPDSDIGFKALSLHGFTSFLMMFGLVGFAAYREAAVGILSSVLAGMLAGAASVWVIGRLFRMMHGLQASGTLSAGAALGSEGSVYLTIPAGGTGRILVNVRNRLREYDAAAGDRGEIKTGEKIRVIRISGNLLVVERIQS